MAKRKKEENPFICAGYEGPDYFCDREKEAKYIAESLQNGVNITLVSPRRMGKTGLIRHVFYQLSHEKNDALFLYIDIFSTKNAMDFCAQLSSAVVNGIVNKSKPLYEKALHLLSALRPVVSADPLTGAPTFSVTVQPESVSTTLKSAFEYLGRTGKDIYIAIDEFQQITEYPETGIEAELRTYIQFAHNVHFIFSGSKHHLMTEMFGSPKRPFFHSTDILTLAPIAEDTYYAFADSFFQAKGGSIDREVFSTLYRQFDGITWYVQNLLNRLYRTEKHVGDIGQVNRKTEDFVNSQTAQYEMLSQFLSANQFSLLKAIAKDDVVAQPTSASFIKRHGLSGASSVKAAMSTLVDKELVYQSPQGYIVYDRLMNLWLKRIAG